MVRESIEGERERERERERESIEGREWERTARKCSSERKTDSRECPTRPDGTDVKNGEPPKMEVSSARAGGRRKRSMSSARENCGSRVSNLVDTTTVRRRSGSTCRGGSSRSAL
jgi:hypothetical protein